MIFVWSIIWSIAKKSFSIKKHKHFYDYSVFPRKWRPGVRNTFAPQPPGRRTGGSSPEAGRGTNPKNETGGRSLTRDRPRKRGSDVAELSRKYSMATKKALNRGREKGTLHLEWIETRQSQGHVKCPPLQAGHLTQPPPAAPPRPCHVKCLFTGRRMSECS